MGKFDIRHLLFLLINITVLFIVSCDSNEIIVLSNSQYTNQVMAEDFKAELKKSGIPFMLSLNDKGEEYVYWNREHDDLVEKIKIKITGTSPPNDRSKRINGIYSDLVQDIINSNIPYTTMKSMGEEYIVWQEEDFDKVRELFEIRKRKAIKRRDNILSKIEKETIKYSNIPQWSIDSGNEAPFLIGDATSVAKGWAEKKWPNSNGIQIDSISLQRVLQSSSGEWWSYYVTVTPNSYVINKSGFYGGEVVIRMDGSVYSYKANGTDKFVLTSQSNR